MWFLMGAESSGLGGVLGSFAGKVGQNHLFQSAAKFLLIQPRMQLSFWTANAHCHVMLIFPFANTPKFFSSDFLSITSLPSLYLCLGLPQPRCRTLYLDMLNFELHVGPAPKYSFLPVCQLPHIIWCCWQMWWGCPWSHCHWQRH